MHTQKIHGNSESDRLCTMDTQDRLKKAGAETEDHEYYTPIPKGYKIGSTKYVIVTGSVMSGLGKGIFASSMAKLLQFKGLKVAPIKLEGYLNIDAGTLNPYRHGEVFVLDDGMECDMDLGTYERLLNLNLTARNFITAGKLYTSILERERKGSYLGRDVQIIPHVTGEIKRILRKLAMESSADVVFVEIGGTVGDIENNIYIEAARELRYEEGKENVCVVNLTYVLEPSSLGEQKSKAAQLGIRNLMSLGLQPDIVACRSVNPITEKIREKISIFSNVPLKRVVGVHNIKNIYRIPLLLKEVGLDKEVVEILNLQEMVDEKREKKALEEWREYIEKTENSKKEITIGITGKYTGLRDSYASILHALDHAAAENNASVKVKWIETTEIENGKPVKEYLKDVDGVIVPGGFGKRGTEGKISCIQYARENNIPYLGLCFGFQMALIEFARNICGLKNANSTELDIDTPYPVIDLLPEQRAIEGLGGSMRLGLRKVEIKKGTIAYKLFGNTMADMRFRHRYECNPVYIEKFEKKGMVFSGKAPNVPIMQILELPGHPYFIGTQAHPEFTSKPQNPNPLYLGFVKACLEKE